MNIRAVFHLIAYMLAVLGIAMGLCAGISILYDDPAGSWEGIAASAGLTVLFSAILGISTRGTIDLSRRDGFGIVAFGWLGASLLGALPYLLTGIISSPAGAIFETMSGFTTTGASVLNELEQIPKGILFWRSMTHWFGGMGVLILCVAILPFLGVGGMQIYRAEMPGPSKDRLTPRIASTAKLLWGVYVLLCLVMAVLLRLGGMDWFDSFCHSFATMATGGFSTRTASIGAYDSLYFDIVIIVFMFLAGTNFSLHYYALRGQVGRYFKDAEFRFYLGLWLVACLFLTLNTWGRIYPSFWQALRASFFQGTSILTTTGFVTEDFDLWPNASRVMLVLLMFIGGCAGSTGGGMKVVRIFILLKKIFRELKRFIQPQAVWTIKLGRQAVEQSTISHISGFFIIFMLLFAFFTCLMTFFTPDTESAVTSVIATMGNIGPGLSAVGATQNYADIHAAGQLILAFCMLLGRLELYTVLTLLVPHFWKK